MIDEHKLDRFRKKYDFIINWNTMLEIGDADIFIV